jgi:lambda family phage portal protein
MRGIDTLPDPFPASEARAPLPVVTASSLGDWRYSVDDGEKFPGGIGSIELLLTDYWALRAHSATVFEKNHYARGIIRCLISNEIHTGLHLEATPEESILGYEEDGLADWSESVENRFAIWGKSPYLCHHGEQLTFGALQQLVRQEALVVGDVLCVLRQDQKTQLPRIQLINGASVQTPFGERARNITHGVERDAAGRHIAYWVTQQDGSSKRLPAIGEKSGRRLAWLIYGADHRLDDVRGKPLLSIVLQSLKEIDRYRDSIQRKATVLSMLAMFLKKSQPVAGTSPITGGAIRRGTATIAASGDGEPRTFRAATQIPGLVLEELAHGEEPQAFQTQGTTEAFGEFEEAILQSIAWTLRIPPESLRMAFSSNYSASQAATNEFKSNLDISRTTFGDNFCGPIYEEWLRAEVLSGRVSAPGFLDAWRDPLQYDKLGAWFSCDWAGNVKPSVKLSDLAKAYKSMIEDGLITRDRASRELTGTKFSKNVQKLRRENLALAEALQPLAVLEASKRPAPTSADTEPDSDDDDLDDDSEDDEDAVEEKKAS